MYMPAISYHENVIILPYKRGEQNSEYTNKTVGMVYKQGFQSADSIHAINLLTSGLFTVNTMW